VVARVRIAATRVELGLRPDEADRLALELAKMQVAYATPKMGAPDLDTIRAERRAWLAAAMPAHVVELGAFEIDVYPVTNAEWDAYGKATGAAHPAREGKPDAFVTGISWREAQEYAHHNGGELPTEAEWECAARQDRRLFTWGDHYFPEGEAAFAPPVLEAYRVGSRPTTASPRGIHDLLGQFGEYTASAFAPYPGADAAAFARLFPQWRGQRVQRGGYDVHQDATCVSRRGVPEDERRTHLKFRCVRR
jgi:formylglycine-generating enzyme required for sulfatase activity